MIRQTHSEGITGEENPNRSSITGRASSWMSYMAKNTLCLLLNSSLSGPSYISCEECTGARGGCKCCQEKEAKCEKYVGHIAD